MSFRGASEQRLPFIVDFYLVRHGEAFSETQDPRRPLTPTGRAHVEQLGRLAAAKSARPMAIFHSGILRAKQTAEILGAQLAPNIQVQSITGLMPEDDPAIAAGELETAQESIMLVGHLPHMNRLAALLINRNFSREVVDFNPASMVCCSREMAQWTLAWMLKGGNS
ncbi:MAG: phosphohistidine phosphatase SixA [Alphaproteobacteria bacterium]